MVQSVYVCLCVRSVKEGDRSCQAGLTCKLTKQLVKMGEIIPVKQCVPEDMKVDLETVDVDDESADQVSSRSKRRFGWFKVRSIWS